MAGPDDQNQESRIGTGQTGDAAADWATMIEDGQVERMPDLPGNDRILSQDEIDGVLGFSLGEVSASGAGGVRAIVDSGIVQYERLPMLEVVFDRMIRSLSTNLRNFFQDTVEVTLGPINSVRFGDYLNAIPLPSLLGVFKAEAWDNSGLVIIDQTLAYASLDLLLGGKKGGVSGRLDGRAFTRIEMGLVRRLVEMILADLELAFQPLSPTRFPLDRIESSPHLATITHPANAALVIGLRLDMDGRGGGLKIVFPYATIEPIRDLLTQSFMGENLGRDPVWEGHLATELWQAELEVEAVLHETMLPLKRVLDMKIGDTLMFERKAADLVTLRCGDWVLTQGRIGRADDAIAVQVVRPLRQSRTSLQTFEAALSNRIDG